MDGRAGVHRLRLRYGIASACPRMPRHGQTRGDGLVPLVAAATRLGVVPGALIHWWRRGLLHLEHSRPGSPLWVRLTEQELARLNGTLARQGSWPVEPARSRTRLGHQPLGALGASATGRDNRVSDADRAALAVAAQPPRGRAHRLAPSSWLRGASHVAADEPKKVHEVETAEGLWHTLKRIELRNVCCHNLPVLRARVRLATARLRQHPARLGGYVHHCTYAQ